MRRFIKAIFFLIIFNLIIGCSFNGSGDNIIDEDVFIDVLVDIHMADATLVVRGYRVNTDSTTIRLFYNDVLIKHKVTQNQIQNTFKHYTKDPKKFEKIYDKVSEKIVKLEEAYHESNTKEELKELKANEEY